MSYICEKCGGILTRPNENPLLLCEFCGNEQFQYNVNGREQSNPKGIFSFFRQNKDAVVSGDIQTQIYNDIKDFLKRNRMRIHRNAVDILKVLEHKEKDEDFLQKHSDEIEELKREIMFLHLYDWFEKAETFSEFDVLERLFTHLNGYLNSKIMAKECYAKLCQLGYAEAKKLSLFPTVEKNKNALNILKRIKGYRDSDVMAEIIKNKIYEYEREELYIKAMNCKVECTVKSLAEAIVILGKIINYRDAAKQKEICEKLISEMEKTELKKEELRRFSENSQGHFQDYRRSSDELKWTIQRKEREELVNQMKNDVQSNVVAFGQYKGQPLEWFILEGSDKFIKLICVKNLYQLEGIKISPSDYVWQDSGIRHWLNKDFYTEAFTETERMLMVSTGRDFERVFSFDETSRVYDKIYIINKMEFTRNNYRIQSFRNSGLYDDTNLPWLLCSSISVRHYVDQKGEVRDLYSEKMELTAHPMITLDIRES